MTERHAVQHLRNLAALGWSEGAIAAASGMSAEQVALALGTGCAPPPAPAEPDTPTATPLRALRSAAQQRLTSRPQQSARRAPEPRTPEEIGRSVIERLAKQRARLQADGALLRAEIERLAITDRASGNRKRGRALRIQRQLARPVALRTVQWHLAAITQKGSPARE